MSEVPLYGVQAPDPAAAFEPPGLGFKVSVSGFMAQASGFVEQGVGSRVEARAKHQLMRRGHAPPRVIREISYRITCDL